MEKEPDTENVAYLDEYPHLSEKVRLKRLGQGVVHQFQMPVVVEIPRRPPDQPDPAA